MNVVAIYYMTEIAYLASDLRRSRRHSLVIKKTTLRTEINF